jgi:hypothetical protein
VKEQQLPSWLSPQNLYVAENLVTKDFHYCGMSDDFCLGRFLEALGDWYLYFSYGEMLLLAVCDEALFAFELEFLGMESDKALEHAKSLISLFLHQWNHNSQNHHQLEMFCVTNN